MGLLSQLSSSPRLSSLPSRSKGWRGAELEPALLPGSPSAASCKTRRHPAPRSPSAARARLQPSQVWEDAWSPARGSAGNRVLQGPALRERRQL